MTVYTVEFHFRKKQSAWWSTTTIIWSDIFNTKIQFVSTKEFNCTLSCLLWIRIFFNIFSFIIYTHAIYYYDFLICLVILCCFNVTIIFHEGNKLRSIFSVIQGRKSGNPVDFPNTDNYMLFLKWLFLKFSTFAEWLLKFTTIVILSEYSWKSKFADSDKMVS